jgi:hypothetical protein
MICVIINNYNYIVINNFDLIVSIFHSAYEITPQISSLIIENVRYTEELNFQREFYNYHQANRDDFLNSIRIQARSSPLVLKVQVLRGLAMLNNNNNLPNISDSDTNLNSSNSLNSLNDTDTLNSNSPDNTVA